MLTINAPAKLNLTLEVLGKRPDGYHEVRSIVQTITLCDTLRFEKSRAVTFICNLNGWDAGKSLVSRAASLIQDVSGGEAGAAVEIDKRIPLMSGLGGDSSDAAAALRGLEKLWGLGLSAERLSALAAGLGSDVAFFLHGGTALMEGRGEIVTPLPPMPRRWAVLVVPDMPRSPGKTGRLYSMLQPGHFTGGEITRRSLERLNEGAEPELFNTFENVAFSDNLSQPSLYRNHLLQMGAPGVHLAGSGPALFSLLRDRARAEDLYTRCLDQGMETYLAETNGCGA